MPRNPSPWYRADRDQWCVTVRGRRYVLAVGQRQHAVALAEFHRLMVSLGAGQHDHPLTVHDLCNAFLTDVENRIGRGELVPRTYETYHRYLASLVARCGPLRAQNVTPHDLHLWAEAPDRSWGPTTRHGAITAVKTAFQWATRRGLLAANPVALMPKPTPARRTAILTPEQAQAVIAAASPAFAVYLTALWLTGCRPGELATLEASGVDATNAILHVRDKIRGKTGRPTREVHVVPEVLALVEPLCRQWPAGPIFRNAAGRPWSRNTMGHAMRAIRDRLGLGPGCAVYAFRHLYGTDALEAGVSAEFVAQLMGHRSTKMLLERYAHLAERRDSLQAAAQRIRPPVKQRE